MIMNKVIRSLFLRKRRKSAQSIIKGKRFISLSIMMLLIVVGLGALWAVNMSYNRPKPLMDYVPQEIGIYDTMYHELTESDCRKCHGNSLAERHHNTTLVLNQRKCTTCHEVTAGVGVSIVRDCTTGGCHSWGDLEDNGWHHNTDMSLTGNCIACHNPGLLAEVTPIRDLEMYPPSVVTPTPFSCENCHWAQTAGMTGDPDSPEHPSTYEHYNSWNQFIGFHEYGKPIYGNMETHHMGAMGNVSSECYQCHALNSENPSWDPENPLLIRYCEICHSIETLHRIGPHVQDTKGWQAAGFHVNGNFDPVDTEPALYRTFLADEQCIGCHGDDLLPFVPPSSQTPPGIDNSTLGIQPNHGCCEAIVILRGENFGEEHESGYSVQLQHPAEDWIDMPIYSWTDTLIEFQIPCWIIMEPGNYLIRVVTPGGISNTRNYTLEDCPSKLTITPGNGTCGTWIKVSISGSGSFSNLQTEIFEDQYHGVHYLVDFVSSQGTYTACNYRNWGSSSFEVQVNDFFQDDPDSDRNFIKDDGTGDCPDEPTIPRCDGIKLGQWAVYVKAIFFGDDNANGQLSCGDTIFQVIASDPLYFELKNQPVVHRIIPLRIKRGSQFTTYGLNFGPVQGSAKLRVGTLTEAQTSVLGKGVVQNVRFWSNTRIKAKLVADANWQIGSSLYLWVEKDGMKSNYQRFKMIP